MQDSQLESINTCFRPFEVHIKVSHFWQFCHTIALAKMPIFRKLGVFQAIFFSHRTTLIRISSCIPCVLGTLKLLSEKYHFFYHFALLCIAFANSKFAVGQNRYFSISCFFLSSFQCLLNRYEEKTILAISLFQQG